MTTKKATRIIDPFAAKRRTMLRDFDRRMFGIGGFFGGDDDTYKRTMWAAVPDIAVERAVYHLTLRKPLPEEGADNQLIMSGIRPMMMQWFFRPFTRKDIELARIWFKQKANAKAFPDEVVDALLAKFAGQDKIYIDVDIRGFAGGQTFLVGQNGQSTPPILVFKGMGGLVSMLEPAMCRFYAPVIQATKGMLMKEATPDDAEFGLRSAPNQLAHLVMLLSRYVGSGRQFTSNDAAEFMWPHLFKSIGTVGHEMVCAGQRLDRSLTEAEYEMMTRAIQGIANAKLLCDLVDANSVGRLNLIRVLSENPEKKGAGSRVDSGKIADQCIQQHRDFKANGNIGPRVIVFEDEVSPTKVREVRSKFRAETGEDPVVLFPGEGGYFWTLVHRDTVSAAFKRSKTGIHPNMKFSNSPGKESLPGEPEVYGQDDTLYIADISEAAQGEALYTDIVRGGRYVYRETEEVQHQRALRTWRRYKRVVLSPKISEWKAIYEEKRRREIEEAKRALSAA